MAYWSTMTSGYVMTDHVLGEVTKTKQLATPGELIFSATFQKVLRQHSIFSQLTETTNTWCESELGKISDKWPRNHKQNVMWMKDFFPANTLILEGTSV